jgi:hypothetical protein
MRIIGRPGAGRLHARQARKHCFGVPLGLGGAAERWATARERFPRRRQAYDRGAKALAEMGLNEEAEQLRAAATAMFAEAATLVGAAP